MEQWPTWDVGLQRATIAEPFAEDARGKIISDQGQTAKFKITAVDEGRSYTFETKLPLGRMEITRSLVEHGDTVRFTHTVRFRGLTGKLFARRLGTGLSEDAARGDAENQTAGGTMKRRTFLKSAAAVTATTAVAATRPPGSFRITPKPVKRCPFLRLYTPWC